MANSKYVSGANLEREVKRHLIDQGALLVVRAAGSKGQVDLVAVFEYEKYGDLGPDVRVYQVKRKQQQLSTSDRNALRSLSERAGIQVLLAYKEDGEIKYEHV